MLRILLGYPEPIAFTQQTTRQQIHINMTTIYPLIDIAVNLTDASFNHDREDVVSRAVQAGVGQLIIPGSTLEESRKAWQLTQRHQGVVFATAGIHPHYSKNHSRADMIELAELAAYPGILAIGEAGLDFNRDASPRPQQEAIFEQQLELAATLQLPILMHERDAHPRFQEIIRHYRDHLTGALVHCFTGSKEALYSYLDLDLHIGITGWICDERRGQHLLPLIKEIPANRMMLETDAPYLLPRTIRPKPKSRRNEPANLPHICEYIATQTGTRAEIIAQHSTATAQRFFDLPAMTSKATHADSPQ